MKQALLFIFTFFILAQISRAECTDSRFKDPIFSDIQIFNNVQYGANVNSLGNMQNLFIDIYMPSLSDDTMKERPVVFLLHGGSFVGGSKTGGNTRMISRELAKRGYVAVAVQYRLQESKEFPDLPILEFADKSKWFRSILRGEQDLKGAIRYMKYSANEIGNPYGIDTNNISLYGSSAGAIAVLHTFYLDESDELSNTWKRSVEREGGLEGNTNAYPYFSTSTVRNLIVDSGALAEIDWITEDQNYADVLAMHYDKDPSVPYNQGCFYTVFCHLDRFFGTQYYAPKVEQVGARLVTYIFDSIAHPLEDNNPQFVLEKTIDFLYESQCKYYQSEDTTIPTGIINRNITELSVYPNPNTGSFRVSISNQDFASTLQVHSVTGQLMHEQSVQKPIENIQLNIPDGVYFVRVIQRDGTNHLSKIIIKR